MTEPKSKADKEAGNLSETAKSYLDEVWIENNYSRKKDFTSKMLEKGVYCEEDSLTLLSEVDNRLYIKNKESSNNDYIKGTPDIIDPELIIDIKTCWDIFTFHNSDITKIYEWQLKGYMWLCGKIKAQLIYTLVDAPEHLIIAEQQKAYYQHKFIDYDDANYQAIAQYIEFSLKYSDIPKELRLKRFDVQLTKEDIDTIIRKVIGARNYYSTIKL